MRKFLFLEWKAFFRSASFKMNLFLKIVLGIFAFIYLLIILSLGVSVFYLLKEKGREPLSVINQFLIYWWVGDLLFRYFLQKSPIMAVKPLLTLPISKTQIVSYFLNKSAFSFFNIYASFFFLPFTIVLLMNGYSVLGTLAWHVAMFSLTYANNYLNLLIESKNRLFVGVALILVTFGLTQYFGLLDITAYSKPIFQAFYNWPWIGFLIILLPISLYLYCFNYFKSTLQTDEAVQTRAADVNVENLSWLEKYGTLGTFLKNDIKLIKRNKRSKSTVVISFLFLFYGLLIVTNDSYSHPVWALFTGIFVSGGFLFTFGGFVPSWDSSYYPLMMTQNIKYKEYLTSKWWLIVIATAVSMVLASFYLAFGWKVYLGVLVGGLYNIGVNAHIVLLGGAYVKTPVDLTSGKKPLIGDKKAFNINTLLVTLPKIILPLLVLYFFYKNGGIQAGYMSVAVLGMLGLALRNKVFAVIEKIYKVEKYATLSAFKEKN